MTLYEYICQLRKEQNLDQETFAMKFNEIIENKIKPQVGDLILKLRKINKDTVHIMEQEHYTNCNITTTYILSNILNTAAHKFINEEAKSIFNHLEPHSHFIDNIYNVYLKCGYTTPEIGNEIARNNYFLLGEEQSRFLFNSARYGVYFECKKNVKLSHLYAAFDYACKKSVSLGAKINPNDQYPHSKTTREPFLPSGISRIEINIDNRQLNYAKNILNTFSTLSAYGGDKAEKIINDLTDLADTTSEIDNDK